MQTQKTQITLIFTILFLLGTTGISEEKKKHTADWPRLHEALRNPAPDLSAYKPIERTCMTYLDFIGLTLEMYHFDFEKYPATLTDLTPQYLKKVVKCPLGGEFKYQKKDGEWTLLCTSRHTNFPQNYPRANSEQGVFASQKAAFALWKPK